MDPNKAASMSPGDLITSYFSRMRLDEENTKRLMGVPYGYVSPESLLHGSLRVLNVAKGAEEADSRDNPSNQKVYDFGDHLATYLALDRGGVLRGALWKLRNDPARLEKIQPALFDQHINHHLNGSGLAQVMDLINPLETYNQRSRITRLGEGAIENLESAPDEARAVQPGYVGVIDAIRAPECYSADMEVMTERGWKAWPEVQMTDRLACRVDERLSFEPPIRLMSYDYAGPMYGTKSKTLSYLVTPNHRMWVRTQAGTWRFELAEEMHGKLRVFSASHLPFEPDVPLEYFSVPLCEARNEGTQDPGMPPVGASMQRVSEPIPMDLWVRFLGYYLSEGCTFIREDKSLFGVAISQSAACNPEVYAEIEKILEAMPFRFYADANGEGFRCHSKQLALYLRSFGKSDTKFIPDYVFEASASNRRLFLDCLLRGDGRKDRSGVPRTLGTISKALALDVARLAFSLGIAPTVSFERDTRPQASAGGCWCVRLNTRKVRTSYHKNARHPEGQQFVEAYTGKVYCAEVSGGLLFVRRSGTAGVWCGNSLKIGLDMFMARNAVKGPDNRLYTRLVDTKTGKIVWMTPSQLESAYIGNPGVSAAKNKFVPALSPKYGIQYVPKKDVQYELLSGDDLFSGVSDTLPLKSTVKGMRQLMGTKMSQHAVPLVEREAPLVSTPFRDGRDSMDSLGEMVGAMRSPVAGTVTKVGRRHMAIMGDDGNEITVDYADWKPYARKTHLEQKPLVKAGDRVDPGSLIVSSNYTDPDGKLAIGRNLRMGYMGYRGRNFEDAVVISSSAAKKLTSLHTYGEEWEPKEGEEVSGKKFRTLFPSKYRPEQFDMVGEDGFIRVGTTVKRGDPLVLAVQSRDPSQSTMGRRLHQDRSMMWEHDEPGVIRKVVKTRDGYRIFVEAKMPMQVGDKLLTAFGAKGTVSEIVPDEEMVKDSQGRPMELLMSAKGLPSRTNPGIALTALLGKAAAAKGQRYILPGAFDESAVELVKKELESAGLSDTEDLFDPRNGKTVPKVFTGVLHVYKAQQMSEAKGHARETGGYSADEDPSKGGGCFVGDQTVQTLHGDVRISRLVEKRLSAQVWSLDVETGTWGYRPVVDWFVQQASVDDVLSIHIGDAISTCGGKATKHDSVLRCTRDHRICLYDGSFVPAGELVVGSVLASYGPVPSDAQKGAILGTLLGDAYVSGDLQAMHSEKQKNYADFKQSIFSGLLASCSSIKSEGTTPNGRSHRRCLLTVPSAALRSFVQDLCYKSRKKVVTPRWLAGVSDLGMCLWFLDDGSVSYRPRSNGETRLAGALIATHGFEEHEVGLLCQFVRDRLGVPDVVMSREGTAVDGHPKYSLRLGITAAGRMVDMISACVPWRAIPASKRGLIDDVRTKQDNLPVVTPSGVSSVGTVPAVVRKIEKYTHPKGAEVFPVYDFSVDGTHTYTTGGVAVSNSSAKHVGPMEMDALLAHGATNILRELKTVHGQYNPELWRQIKLGGTPSIPRTPSVYDKFRSLLRAANVNLQEGTREGDKVFAATDADIRTLTGDREVTSSETYDRKMRAIPGGIFDPQATGSEGTGDRFAYISLPEPMLNPHMEASVRYLTGMRKVDLDDIIAGRKEVNGKRGGLALQEVLSNLDLDKVEKESMEILKAEGMISKKDAAAKRLMYAQAMKAQGKKPADFLMTRVPVLPPKYRRIVQQDDRLVVPDLNYLYRRLLHSINDFQESKPLGEELRAEAREDMMHAYRSLIGTEEPTDKDLKARRVGGVIQQLVGKGSPKASFVQRKVFGVNVDMSGLASIVPNPDLKLNQVGIPEKSAWTLYAPFVIRRLVEKGRPAMEAAAAVKAQDPTLMPVLQEVMKERPVLANRAPTLHKYGLMAFEAVPVPGNALHINPQITGPFGADFDGNCLDFDECVFLKISKSVLETYPVWRYAMDSVGSIQRSTEMLTESADVTMKTTLPVRLRIGEFPRTGEPMKDRNGADVYPVPEGVSVLSFDPKTSAVGFYPVTHFTVENDVECCDVQIGSQHVVLSSNESLSVFDSETGCLKKVAPKDAVGTLVPRLLSVPREFGEYGTFDFGWWVGVFVSDGWVSGHMVGHSKLSEHIRDRFIALTRDLFQSEYKLHEYCREKADATSYGRGIKVHFNSQELADTVRSFGFYSPEKEDCPEKRSALFKTIPQAMLAHGSEEFLWGVVSGLCDGDCSLVVNHTMKAARQSVRFNTSSRWLRDDIQQLFLKLGVPCSCTTVPPRGKSAESYIVIPSSPRLHAHIDRIRCAKPESVKFFEDWSERSYDSKFDSDVIPLTFEEATGLKDSALAVKDMTAYSGISKSRQAPRLHRTTVMRLLSREAPDTYSSLRSRCAADVAWEPVKGFTDAGRRQVFDLEVPETKVFVTTGGLVVFDTMSFIVPVSRTAVQEAREKMFPEKNLISVGSGAPHYMPTQEPLEALYIMTKSPKRGKPVRRFVSKADMMAAYRAGEIDADDPVEITGDN